MAEAPVFVALTAAGAALAVRLRGRFPGAEVHGLAGRAGAGDVTFADAIAHLQSLFRAGRPIVGICAAGILVRALAPLLADKRAEPPVVALAEDGSAAVPLLGGHGGANRLARDLAALTGGAAAVTTAGDLRLGLALDDPPPGWRLADRAPAKDVAAALLAGEPVALEVEAGDAGWLTGAGLEFTDGGAHRIRVTDRAEVGESGALVLHPPVLALGVGCERGADAEELIALAGETLAGAGLATGAVACVVSVGVKADEAAVHALAAHLEVPARFFTVAEVEAQTPRLANPSDVVFREVGCHGVAEGAALAAVGAAGELAVEKRKGARTTCAVARSPAPLDPAGIGRARGRLAIVGIGPGTPAWRTPEATRLLSEATDVVGYGLYLDLVAEVIAGKARHDSPLAQEEARARRALDLAAEGRAVALVGSGDAGIYALATLVFELLDREDRADWNRVAVAVSPGVSAFQAAAARIGAPMGHDFCTISLSDLLTPWEEIERRLRAAAAGDFVVAFYNPVSQRRRSQLARARDILLTGRGPDTPVVLARNLGRDGETVDVTTLGALTPDMADMLTVVVVGNGQTRLIARGQGRWVYTPRGYAAKMDRGTTETGHEGDPPCEP
ncbi:MAG: precorrin-3B C(17)-methyltransferase [Hyphomicrobiales bacterium]|nr:precorrin-3B C(17)-methyltransferase [Hyphomicrobiales bacterium]